MARRILPNLNSVKRNAERNALKAAINNSLRVYMTSQTNANLRAVNNATKALIKTYVEEHEEKAPTNVPTGNGGNNRRPNQLLLSNKPHTNNGNGNGGNQSRAIVPVGKVTPLGPNMNPQLANPLANRAPNEKNRQPTAVNLNRLRGIAKNGASNNNTILKSQTNFVNALTRNFPNHQSVKAAKIAVNARRTAKNAAAANTEARVKAVEAAKNAEEAERAAREARNANTAAAAAKAERNAREAANAAARNAAAAKVAAEQIAANQAASAAAKKKAANNQAAANKAAREAANAAANAAKKAAEIKSKWQRAGQGVGKAAQAASLLKAAGNARVTRRSGINAQIAAAKAMNAAYTNYMNKISGANTMNSLGAINRNIVASANLNGPRKTNLRTTISNKQKKIAIQKKKNEGKTKRNYREARINNSIVNRGSLNAPNKAQTRETVQSLTTNYNEFLKKIRNAHSAAEITRLREQLARNGRKTVGVKFTPEQRANLSSRVNNKNGSLKGPGPSPNAPKNGGPNNINPATSVAELEKYLRLIEGRKKSGKSLNTNANFEKRVRARLNLIRPKGRGLFGHIGGALGAVGGAAKYVAAGTAHHTTRGVKAAAGVAAKGAKVAIPLALAGAAYLGQQGAKRGFNVTVGGKKPSKKIPNTSLNNGNKKPGKLERAVQKNENIAAARKAYQRSVGGNASENSVSAAGALGALAVAGGAHTAARAAAALKRASNLGRAAKTGMYTAKTLRYAAK
jgi:hypothetical protein